jgi:hypothetical protein
MHDNGNTRSQPVGDQETIPPGRYLAVADSHCNGFHWIAFFQDRPPRMAVPAFCPGLRGSGLR